MNGSLKFQSVTNAEISALLGRAFNPPVFDDGFTEKAFSSEYWTVHAAVADALSILGTQDQFGSGDFCANDDWGFSRFIGIELTSKRLWHPELIPLVQSALLKQPHRYVVYFEHALLDEPRFYLLVQTDAIIGYVPTEIHLRAFGL